MVVNVFGDAAHAVAAHLRFGAVGVEHPHASRGHFGRTDEDHAIAAHAKVPIRKAPAQCGRIGRKRLAKAIDVQIVVADAVHLGESHRTDSPPRNRSPSVVCASRLHSRSATGGQQTLLPNGVLSSGGSNEPAGARTRAAALRFAVARSDHPIKSIPCPDGGIDEVDAGAIGTSVVDCRRCHDCRPSASRSRVARSCASGSVIPAARSAWSAATRCCCRSRAICCTAAPCARIDCARGAPAELAAMLPMGSVLMLILKARKRERGPRRAQRRAGYVCAPARF